MLNPNSMDYEQSNLAVASKYQKSSQPEPVKWWSKDTIAVVTGGNKGIGLAFVKRFAELGLTVILTARDETKGQEAVDSLNAKGLKNIEFCKLDITDISSITAFVSWFQGKYTGLDVLVNNAGVSFNDVDGTVNTAEDAETVIKTNFYGLKFLTEAVMPLFRRSSTVSRILNISSQLSLQTVSTVNGIFFTVQSSHYDLPDIVHQSQKISNQHMVELQNEENISESKIEEMLSQFLCEVKEGTWKESGWPKVWTDYSLSKFAVNCYSRLLAKKNRGCGLSVNCFCPGFTRTEMTGGRGHRTAEEAAEIGAKVALLPPDRLPSGEFFKITTPTLTSNL